MLVELNFYHWSDDPNLTYLDTASTSASRHWQGKRLRALTRPVQPSGLTWEAFANSVGDYMKGPVKETRELVKEFIFEDVRRAEFPALPSRRTCLYLIDEVQDPRTYATAMGLTMPHLYHVRVDEGRLHRAPIAALNCITRSHDEIEEHARAYWRGGSRGAETEVLLEGRCRLSLVP
jgi:Protein of unknown function (DUF2441)